MPTKANEAQAFTVPGLVIVRTLTQAPTFRAAAHLLTPGGVRELEALPPVESRDGDDGDGDDPSEVGAGDSGDTTETDPGPGAQADVLGSVEGHFSVFNTWYQINSWWEGDFLESVAPGAFTKTFAERAGQIVSAFDHGFDPYIGDKILGPFTTLAEDNIGGQYAFDLLDATYARDLMPALKRGLYGSSFRFQVIKDEWNMEPEPSDYNPTGLPERTLKEVRVFELGPVTYPASPTASAGMRSGTDRYYDLLHKRDPAGVDDLRSKVHELRTAAHRSAAVPPAADSTDDTAAAPNETNEPANDLADATTAPTAERHSDGMTPAQRRERLYPSLTGAIST